jgi:integrase
MYLSRRSNGIYYIWFVDSHGRKQKVSTHSRLKSDALKLFRSFKETERRTKPSTIFVSQFKTQYLKYSASTHRPNTQKVFESSLNELIRVLGDLPLSGVGVRELDTFLAAKKIKSSEHTIRKHYVTLASAFERARKWGYITKNPIKEVEKPKLKEVQPAHFSRGEFQQLLAIISDNDFRGLCIVAVSTGMRMGELIALEWSNIDFVRKVIAVQNSDKFTTKSKKNRVIPMNEPLWCMLARRKEVAFCELVFHAGGRKLDRFELSRTFKQIVIRAGLSDRLHFHSLPHLCHVAGPERGRHLRGAEADGTQHDSRDANLRSSCTK